MTKLKWDQDSERLYETGTSNGVLYVQEDNGSYGTGVAWNGLISVAESPSGAEETALYANNSKYASMRSAEEEEGSITAYTYPDEWMACDGSVEVLPGFAVGQQTRRAFGLTWRTILGNDVQLDGYGYKLHIIYSGTVSPSEKEYSTVNDSPEAIEFSWDYKCTPIDPGIEGATLKKSAVITLTSTKIPKAAMAEIEGILYGSENSDSKLPSPKEIFDILKKHEDKDEDEENDTDTQVETQNLETQTQSTKAASQVSTTKIGSTTSNK